MRTVALSPDEFVTHLRSANSMVTHFSVHEGSPHSGVVLHVPHASRIIPADVRRAILLSDQELERELDQATDTHTDILAERAADRSRLRPWKFVNGLSRLVVDPERFPDEREIMNKVGHGAVYQRAFDGRLLREPDPRRDAGLLATYFDPYADALNAVVRERLAVVGRVCIVDVHSYRVHPHLNDVDRGPRRPIVCMGTDDGHTPRWLKDAFVSSFAGLGEVLENVPYSGTYVPLEFYGREPRVASVMLELRADAFLDPQLGLATGADRVAESLAALVDQVELLPCSPDTS